MIDGRVVGDLEDPGRELELGAVTSHGVQHFDEGFLGKVFGQLPVAHHAVDEGEDRPLVATDELAVASLVALPGELDDLLVGQAPQVERQLSHADLLAKEIRAGLH